MVTAQIAWRPFELNPTMPPSGMDRRAYLEAKFGSLAVFRPMEEQVLSAGASEEISFQFHKIARTPNTFLAHRVIWYAGRQGLQDRIVDALFRGYFEEGQDLGALPVLVQLAARAGLEPQKVEPMLRSDEGAAEVRAEESAGLRLGLRGVPHFVFNGAYALSGAQPVERFVAAITKIGAVPELRSGR